MNEEKTLKRYELQDRICYSVCVGNEYQTKKAVREWMDLGVQGRITDRLTEWKYHLIQMMALMIQSLREIGVPELSLEETRAEFTAKIFEGADTDSCQGLFEELSVRLCRMNSLKEIRSYSMLVQTMLRTIDQDLSQPLTLTYFARMLNVNSSYLSHLFSKEVGMPLTEYVTAQRISYAADLLLTTAQPIKTIAKKAGISDVQYFSRLFKRRTGQTPSQYRLGAAWEPEKQKE
ncbi:MAG: helix-turn-helix transcriptional regulator [Lachnospiraceae bacterium]|nr:helix-turn-helix transcriptional regulator [Lachnospiraceae bacterium]